MSKIIAIYDNNGISFDRYTIYLKEKHGILNDCFVMSDNPNHSQGIAQHSSGMLGSHNGKKITFDELPKECQSILNNLDYEA